MTFKNWWQKYSDELDPDNQYEFFERAWEAAVSQTLVAIKDCGPRQLARMIARAELEKAIEENDRQYLDVEREQVIWDKEQLAIAENKIKQK